MFCSVAILNLFLMSQNINLGGCQGSIECPSGLECLPHEMCEAPTTPDAQHRPCSINKDNVCCPLSGIASISRNAPVPLTLRFRNLRDSPSQIACSQYRSRRRLLCLPVFRPNLRFNVVGGMNTDFREDHFGHMALLGHQSGNATSEFCMICGGTLISDAWVLTAAHCISKGECKGLPNVVRLAEHDISFLSEYVVSISIKEAIVHPQYIPTPQYNDIALIKLETPVKLSRYIYPACLPPDTTNTYEKDFAIVTGWGKLNFGGRTSNILQKATVAVLNNEECRKKYGTLRHIPDGILDSQLCAGVPYGNVDACSGDSGGPLQLSRDCYYEVIGVVSLGVGCGDPNYPGVYTRISKYVTWIEDIVWPD